MILLSKGSPEAYTNELDKLIDRRAVGARWRYRGSPDSTSFGLPGNRTIEKLQQARTSTRYIKCTFRKAVS